MRGGWPDAALAIIVLLAAALRVAPLITAPEAQRNGLGQFGDSFGYHRVATNLLRGHGFSASYDGAAFGAPPIPLARYEPAATRPPAYPFFLAAIYRLGGDPGDARLETWRRRWDAVRLAQALLDAGVCVLVFFLVRGIAPRALWAPYVGAAIYAVSPYNVFYTRALLSEGLATALVTVGLLAAVGAVVRGGPGRWFGAGIAFGVASLCIAQIVLFPFLLGASLVVRSRHARRAAVWLALACLCGFAVAVAPWTLRNAVVFQRFIPICVGGTGWKVFLGSFETKATWRGWGAIPEDLFPDAAERAALAALATTLENELQAGSVALAESDRAAWALARRELRRHPGRALAAWLDGVPRLWYQNYVPMYRDREASGVWVLLFFALAAHAWARSTPRERAGMAPVGLLVLYLTVLFLPLHVEPRYAVVAMPGIVAVAGIGLATLLRDLSAVAFSRVSSP
jgi:hypothetical protein